MNYILYLFIYNKILFKSLPCVNLRNTNTYPQSNLWLSLFVPEHFSFVLQNQYIVNYPIIKPYFPNHKILILTNPYVFLYIKFYLDLFVANYHCPLVQLFVIKVPKQNCILIFLFHMIIKIIVPDQISF